MPAQKIKLFGALDAPERRCIVMYIKVNGKFRSLNRVITAIAVAAVIAGQAYILPQAIHGTFAFQDQVVEAYRK
jgi:hypothetical protein